MQVLLNDAFVGIQRQNDHLCVCNRLKRLYNGELLHRLPNVFPLPYASSVDQGVLTTPTFIVYVNAIPSRAGLVVNDDTILSQHAIHQSRLTHIGTPHNGNPD